MAGGVSRLLDGTTPVVYLSGMDTVGTRLRTWVLLAALCVCVRGIAIVPDAFRSFPSGTTTSEEMGHAITRDPEGSIYVVGRTISVTGYTFGSRAVDISGRESEPADQLSRSSDQDSPPSNFSGRGSARFRRSTLQIPSGTEHEHVSDDLGDLFVVKYRNDGGSTREWVRAIGSDHLDIPTAIAYRSGKLYIAGRTFGSLEGSTKDTPDQTSDIFVMALEASSGKSHWEKPIQIGSGGDDGIEDLAFGESSDPLADPVLYVSGYTSGVLFSRQAIRMESCASDCMCSARKSNENGSNNVPGDLAITTRHANSRDSVREQAANSTSKEPTSKPVREAISAGSTNTDFFVAKVDIARAEVIDGVQVALQRNNTATKLVVHGPRIVAAVNSFGEDYLDETRDSSLYVFCTSDLSFRPVFHDENFDEQGTFISDLEVDGNGDVYAGGFTNEHGQRGTREYFVRKYSPEVKSYMWEHYFGQQTIVQPRVSLALSRKSGRVFVAGFTNRFFSSSFSSMPYHMVTRILADSIVSPDAIDDDDARALGFIESGILVLSDQGAEIVQWEKMNPFPEEFEEIMDILVDDDENVLYTGKRLNPDTRLWDMILGSFGSHTLSLEGRSDTSGLASDSEDERHAHNSRQASPGLSTLILGLICLSALVMLLLILAVCLIGRSYMLGGKASFDAMGESPWYYGSYGDEEDDTPWESFRSGGRKKSEKYHTQIESSTAGYSPGPGPATGGSAAPI